MDKIYKIVHKVMAFIVYYLYDFCIKYYGPKTLRNIDMFAIIFPGSDLIDYTK